MTTPADSRNLARRASLRAELFERLERSNLDLVTAVKMMRKITGRTQREYVPRHLDARSLVPGLY